MERIFLKSVFDMMRSIEIKKGASVNTQWWVLTQDFCHVYADLGLVGLISIWNGDDQSL